MAEPGGGITLREMLETQLQAERETRQAWEHAHDTEHTVAFGSMDRRLNEMNELRRQIDRERGLYVTTPTYDANRKALEALVVAETKAMDARVKAVEQELATTRGRASGQMTMWGIGITVLMVLISVAGFVATHLWR